MTHRSFHDVVRHVTRKRVIDTDLLIPLHVSSISSIFAHKDGVHVSKVYTEKEHVHGHQRVLHDGKIIVAPVYVVESSIAYILSRTPHIVPTIDAFTVLPNAAVTSMPPMYAVVVMRRAFMTLGEWITSATARDVCAVLLQVACVLHLLQTKHSFVHGDLHSRNILLFKTNMSKVHWFRYKIDGMSYYAPNVGVYAAIADFQCAAMKDRHGTFIQSSMITISSPFRYGVDLITDTKGSDMQKLLFDMRHTLRLWEKRKPYRVVMSALRALDTNFHKHSVSNVTPQAFAMRMFGGMRSSVCDFTRRPKSKLIKTLINT